MKQPKKKYPKKSIRTRITRNWELYLFLLPAVLLIFCFNYLPMYGVQIAFKNFRPAKGIWGSEWVGLEHFFRFFRSYQFGNLIKNTLILSLYGLLAGFPLPILFALLLNQMRFAKFKKVLQTVTSLPNFISTVVLVGMVSIFLSPSSGIYGAVCNLLGVKAGNPMGEPGLFRHIYVWSGVWQSTGWGSIIYLSALSAVDPSLYEAATIDGANRLQKIRHIDLPAIAPTCVISLILSAGGIMGVGFEKVFLMQNDLNLSASEVISTYVYKVGIQSAQYSFSAAVGLFNTVINFVILVIVNQAAKRLGDTSLW
ncbi:MAG: ABC transporter permease subunit [Eubacteriales bacterium]|nr:ABC transporter permease subunit [Eubacteriales bacterium]